MRRSDFLRIFSGSFLILFPVRLMFALYMAPEIPYYDEWDSLIDGMFRPMLAGTFSPGFFLAPHNEHIIFWTKAVSYVFLRLGDLQFDNVPVCEFNQLLYSLLAALLIALAARNVGRFKWHFVVCAILVAALPYAWENIGTGFQNGFYFLIGFGVGTIVLAVFVEDSIGASILLALMALASGMSMGSGFFAAIVAMGVLVLRRRAGLLSTHGFMRMFALLAAAVACVFALIGRHEGMALGWGLVQSAQLAILLLCWTPTWLLFLRIWRGEADKADITFACISLWALMQIGAILLGRPAFRLWLPISRYVDVLAVAAFANLGSLARLAIASPKRRLWTLLTQSAFVMVILASISLSPMAWHWAQVRADSQREQTQLVARYVHDADTAGFDDAPEGNVPYPVRARLRTLIDAPDVRWILGDQIGTRPVAAPFVVFVRALNAVLQRFAIWLLLLAFVSAALILGGASWLRRQRN